MNKDELMELQVILDEVYQVGYFKGAEYDLLSALLRDYYKKQPEELR